MAQQHNQFGSNTNQNPNTTYSSIPGLFPTALPFQTGFQQPWSNTPNWQTNGQYDCSAGNLVPGKPDPSNGYFSGQQADYIALDNGEEFYGNQDQTMTGMGDTPFAPSSQVALSNSLPSQPTPQNSNPPNPQANSETSQMLTNLRAKLMMQKAAAEKSKTPEASVKTTNINGIGTEEKLAANVADASSPKPSKAGMNKPVQTTLKSRMNGSKANQASPVEATFATASNVNDNASKVPAALDKAQPTVSSHDIDALFSSVRATEAAKKERQMTINASSIKIEEAPPRKEKMVEDRAANKLPAVTKPKPVNNISIPPLRIKGNAKNATQDSTSSSEQLEQGEIREELSKSTPPSTKPSTPKVPSDKVQSEMTSISKDIPEPALNKVSTAQPKAAQSTKPQTEKSLETQISKQDMALTADDSRGKTNVSSQKPASPTVARPPGLKPKDNREPPTPMVSRNDRREDRPEQHDRRGDFYDDRRGGRRLDYHEPYSTNSHHSYDRSRAYDREYDRDRSYRGESFRPPPQTSTRDAAATRLREDEAATEAPVHRKSLSASSQRLETRTNPKPSPKEDGRRDSKVGRVLEIRTAFSAPESPLIEKGPSTVKDANPEDAADIQDWLEMTGYFDKPYRDKALARHRKLVELDRQRAELEMETKVELEERLHLARFSSLMPRTSIEGRSFTPQVFAKPPMPPPTLPATGAPKNVDAVPAQEPKADVGIQIKDLARRNSAASTPRVEDARRGPRPTQDMSALTPGLKRHRSGDLADSVTKSTVKLPRTDCRSYSIEKKGQASPTSAKPAASASLESRISVDNGTQARREYQARSRSPEIPRRRSPSPLPHYRNAAAPLGDSRVARRLSDDDGYSPLRRPDLSRNASPHMRGAGPPYDGFYDTGGSSHARYERYHQDYDTRSNPSYDSYTNDRRGAYRGRGRARGRAGHVQYRGSYTKTFDRRGSE